MRVESYRIEFWEEAVGDAFCQIDKWEVFETLTKDEQKKLGENLARWAESEGSAYGWDVASSNRSAELRREEDDLRKELQRERNKVTCRECNGHGRLRYSAGPWAVDSSCDRCNSTGRHDP